MINNVPRDVKHVIISYLDPTEKTICCCVNQEWRNLASDDIHWKDFIPKNVTLPKGSLRDYCIISNIQLQSRIEKYISNFSFNEYGTFECTDSSGEKISIKFSTLYKSPSLIEDDPTERNEQCTALFAVNQREPLGGPFYASQYGLGYSSSNTVFYGINHTSANTTIKIEAYTSSLEFSFETTNIANPNLPANTRLQVERHTQETCIKHFKSLQDSQSYCQIS